MNRSQDHGTTSSSTVNPETSTITESTTARSESSETSDEEKNSKHSSDDEDERDGSIFDVEYLRKMVANRLTIGHDDDQRHPLILNELNLDGVAEYIKDDKAKNVIVMVGAGLSTSAGVPDFRTPGTGLYDNLPKNCSQDPTSVFDIRYFKENPEPFYEVAKRLYPGAYQPTVGHLFVRLLELKGILLRHYTQNIDGLERLAGISDEKIVEAHGTFNSAHCINCNEEFSSDWVKERVFADQIPHCKECQTGLVKPDIVFFGENLPKKFFTCIQNDFSKCDLLIIMGTSLVVQPFSSILERVGPNCPRLLINFQKVGIANDLQKFLGGNGLLIDDPGNYRDVFWQGSTDDGCTLLAEKLGWKEDLANLVAASRPK